MNHGIGSKGGLTQVSIGGDTYTATVFLVTERDHFGRPLVARIIHDEQAVDLEELGADDGTPPEFIIVYANRDGWGKPA